MNYCCTVYIYKISIFRGIMLYNTGQHYHRFSLTLPSSSVFSLVQLVRSFTFLKCGCFSLRPVSKTATFTPEPAQSQQTGQFPSKLHHISEEGERCSAPTSVPHLPQNVCLEDLGHMAGDSPQETPARVATSGVPET